ncbi:hypothetical protein [Desulfuribacillus alkaliarsenatis]|uniref:Uncharacterized protein n=1 Tax=Desulfuribacillus alkaliarsenatis TaxID=766136 RepID=A0A1E5G364_9FIRM|nr:hypothetical protein [Desulfuribacillus alkaliarsenatis]OEF97424.1 hypothetical protein BHF68_04235 [Desulfuribacillus alkaliarsenatis]
MDKNKQDWSKVREQGKWTYIRKYGVIGWGIQTFIIFYILLNLIEHGLDYTEYFSGPWITEISIYLLVFMLGGAAWGYWMWSSNERKYKQGKLGDSNSESSPKKNSGKKSKRK